MGGISGGNLSILSSPGEKTCDTLIKSFMFHLFSLSYYLENMAHILMEHDPQKTSEKFVMIGKMTHLWTFKYIQGGAGMIFSRDLLLCIAKKTKEEEQHCTPDKNLDAWVSRCARLGCGATFYNVDEMYQRFNYIRKDKYVVSAHRTIGHSKGEAKNDGYEAPGY